MSGPRDGQVALVTGASRNIGRAIAVELAGLGADIVVHVARDRAAGEETVAAVQATGRRAALISGDLSQPEGAAKAVAEAEAAFGRLDMLVNNAAVRPESDFADLTWQDWRAVMGVSLDAPFLVSQAALPALARGGQGAVIHIGGMTGHTGAPNRAHVIAAKAGLIGLTKAMATDLAAQGITVNCVVPGLIDTQRVGAEPKHHGSAKNLLGRRGTPEEVAAAVGYLCSTGGRYITGQTLHVNGGGYMP